MATKSTQRDDGTVVDAETTRAQKGYANYEKDQQEAQKKLESEDAAMKQKFKTSVEKIRGVIGMKMGGKVKDPTMTYQTYSETGKPAGMKTVAVKKASGGSVSSASKRADGCAVKGKTRGKMM